MNWLAQMDLIAYIAATTPQPSAPAFDPSGTGIEWETFAALVTAAATLATAVSTSVVLWLRRRDRTEADWAVLTFGPKVHKEATYGISGRLTNAGDGAAFRVHVAGSECKLALFADEQGDFGSRAKLPFVPLIGPGEEVRVRIECDHAAWRTAELVIEWTRSPTRLGKRTTHRLPVRDIVPANDEAA